VSWSDGFRHAQGLEDLSVGASIPSGELEVTFVVDAADLIDAQPGPLGAFNETNALAAQRLANRIGGQLNPDWTSSHTDLTELIPA
jgi:hypothetical protein